MWVAVFRLTSNWREGVIRRYKLDQGPTEAIAHCKFLIRGSDDAVYLYFLANTHQSAQ